MPKPSKPELTKYRTILSQQLSVLRGDVGSMRDEALRASEQDNSVDHLADQGTDNYDQSFLLGLIENEEETITMIEQALERIDGKGDIPYGQCIACAEELEAALNPVVKPKPTKPVKESAKDSKVAKKGSKLAKSKAGKAKLEKSKPVQVEKPVKIDKNAIKIDPWIPKERLEYIPWARYCLRHQEDEERNRETA